MTTQTDYPEFPDLEINDVEIPENEITGDHLCESPDSGTTRLYFQNINGLRWDNQAGKWPYICEVVEGIQADIACFAEINTNTNNYQVRQQMEIVCQRQFHQSRLILSSSTQKTASTYKPGGTAILTRNAITARIKSHTRDRMGRWASVSIETTPTKRIRIISAYQVCHTYRRGTNTAAAQQQAQLINEQARKDQYTRQTPREAFIQDLQAFIQQVQNEREEIILVGDFNEVISTPNAGMNVLATTCGLADLFNIRLGTPDQPATYQRGQRRLDYALVSTSLIQHVRAAGYDPFGYRIPSDHRGFYIDFTTAGIFSQELTPLANPDKRDFLSTTPGTVAKYIQSKMKYLNEHNFFERMQTLNELTIPDHTLAESLDRDYQRASTHAARKCARIQQAPWSPKLAEAWAELHFYRLAQSSNTVHRDFTPAIIKLQNEWQNLPRELPTSDNEIKTGYENALAKLRDVRKAAKAHREEYLEQKAAMYAALEEQGKSKIIRRLLRAEAQHRVYNKIRQLRAANNNKEGLTSLKIPKNVPLTDTDAIKVLPDTPDHWETINVPETIEQLLLQRNRHHFSQAEGTPFTVPPLRAEIGYKADGFATDMILEGRYKPQNITRATRLLIEHLQSRTTAQLEGRIHSAEIRAKLKRWKESTTTSPSGLHLGHYHCLWRDPMLHSEPRIREKIIDDQGKLLNCMTDLLNYALKFAYTYERWRKVINVMLQKDRGNPRIHRLRVIHIYEADYNLLLAVKWRQALHHAEDNNLLNKSLYGSRPGRSAHEPALIEVLQNEIYRMSMKSGVNFDLDATSCYDRILSNLASICCRRIGMHKQATLLNASTLEQAKYHIKTSLGISCTWYQHSEQQPIHGTGQGSGNSPTIWCFVCSALFDALEAQAHGAVFTDYAKTTKEKLYITGFVDDCTQRINMFEADTQPTTQQLLSLMQKDAQLWNDLLWASGGALEQPKCSFHLIQTSWNADGQPFLTGDTQSQQIRLKHENTWNPTYQKSNYTSHKTLGCWVNPSNNNSKTWSVLQTKNEEFVSLLDTNCFTRVEAWTLYTSTYLPSMTYPLPITPLTIAQCQTLDTRFFSSLVPRCGYNRHMATAVRYAPFSMGGAGFKPLYVHQGILSLQQVFKFLNSPDTQVGKLLIMTLTWTQAFLGTSEFFLTNTTQKLPPTPPSILLDLRQFLHHIRGKLTLSTPVATSIVRQQDRFIMDIALRQTKWKPRHLAQINACRRYLQAQSLADITNMAGTKLLSSNLDGEQPPSANSQRTARFNQSRPGQSAWKTWQRFLSTISDKRGYLVNPLGPWIVDHTELRKFPEHIYDPDNNQLFTHAEGENYYRHHSYTEGTFLTTHHDGFTQATGYPTAVLQVAGVLRPQKNYITPRHQPITNPTESPFSNLPPWEKELLQHCELLLPLPEIHQKLANGNIISCSDGSATINNQGSFGFVISSLEGIRLLRGKGPAPGAYSNSFRSESYGVLASMRCLHQLLLPSITTSEQDEITHYLDNQSVIDRIEEQLSSSLTIPNRQLLPECDVINEIIHTVKHLPTKIKFKWVRGHQDRTTPQANLPLPAQLNCEADSQAESYNRTDNAPKPIVNPLPSTPCQLEMQGTTITSKFKYHIYNSATTPQLLNYLQRKFHWEPTTITAIDWENFTAVLQKYKDRWPTIVKHLHNASPTGKIAHRNNKHLAHECPACTEPQESNLHVITCKAPSRALWRQQTIRKITTYKRECSDPYLLDILHDGLLRLHNQLEPLTTTSYPDRYRELIQTQQAIGWDQLYKARWSKEWRRLQQEYSNARQDGQPQFSGQSWVLGTCRLLMDQWLELWSLRNSERHNKDVELTQQTRFQRLRSELTELYSYRTKVCPDDRKIFYNSMEEHIENHPRMDSIEEWICLHKEAIIASATQAAALGITRNRNLLECPMFNPTHQPGT